MKALQLVEPTVLRIVDVPIPVPAEDEVLLEVRGAGLCHSDLHLRQVPMEVFPLPFTLGHEVAGTIAATGRAVGGFSPGDAVLVHVVWACGRCRACSRGDDNVCEAAGRMAQPPTPGLGRAGGMAEYMAVPARHLVPIGDLDPVAAAPLADAAMTSYHAVRNSRRVLRPDATAVVVGVGGLGHLAVQILRVTTAVRIVVVDIDQPRLRAAIGHGADQSLLADDQTTSAILDLTDGRGADAVFDFVGSQSTVDLAVNVIAPDGIVQLLGVSSGRVDISAGPRFGQGWPYGASLRTSYGGTRSDLDDCVALARAGHIGVDVTRFALDEGIEAFDRLQAGDIDGRAVLLP